MSKPLFELAAEIVTAQAANTPMSPEDISDAINKVHQTLTRLQAHESGQAAIETSQASATPVDEDLAKLRTTPNRAIKKNTVVCLECGAEFKILNKKHIASHGLSPVEYREKWGYGTRQALAAKALSEKRRKVAQEAGLGQKMVAARKAKNRG